MLPLHNSPLLMVLSVETVLEIFTQEVYFIIGYSKSFKSRSQWPRGLRRRSVVACLLRLLVQIPPGAWMFVCCECCVSSGRGLCDGLIICLEESYQVCDWVSECVREASTIKGPRSTGGCCVMKIKMWNVYKNEETPGALL